MDCRELMLRFPSESVDLILADPPYNISRYSTGNIPRAGKTTLNNEIADWDKILVKIIFSGYNQIGEWHKVFDPAFDTFQIFVWHKTNPAPKVYRNGFCNSCEFAIFLWNRGHIWNFSTQEEMHNFYECPICSYPERLKSPFHPTQKPIQLLEHFIKIASNPGAIILDPFMGVGSTGVAAIKNDRRFIGCDLNKDYVEAAQRRIITNTDVAYKPLL